MHSALRSILGRIRGEAILAMFCHSDPGAISVINWIDSLLNSDGTINREAIVIASEVLRET